MIGGGAFVGGHGSYPGSKPIQVTITEWVPAEKDQEYQDILAYINSVDQAVVGGEVIKVMWKHADGNQGKNFVYSFMTTKQEIAIVEVHKKPNGGLEVKTSSGAVVNKA